ncbi:hypothetical protein HELRODRAFT_179414 [Helobdella robusta]|uniref:Ig-like domain-containing protein n=1 Tax=Helobdella robusta TaxID=6412 RepID=T1FEN7_HELRO|nr:hypothetical protein HELRODRAFT_179414 [Helobdella robusta]ESN95346.1 hypothetical protein HELRODRAFT_179414 [Helobdella robusta]
MLRPIEKFLLIEFLVVTTRHLASSAEVSWHKDEFFVNAYTDTARSMKDAIYLQQNVTVRRLKCTPEGKPEFNKQDADECEWRQPNGRSLKLERMQIDDNTCELVLDKMYVEDGGTYTCMHIRNGGINRPVYERDIVIYESPILHVTNKRHYSVKECDSAKINQFIVEMRSWLCIGCPTNCIFHVKFLSCEGVEGANSGTQTAIFEINRYLDQNVHKPLCNLDCVKQYFEKLLLDKVYTEGMETLKANEPAIEEITGYVPLVDRNTEALAATCLEGFFVYKDLVCMPCAAGYYRTKEMPVLSCSECGYFYYQSKIASSSCVRCPWLGFSNARNKITVLSCVPMYMTWQFVAVISLIPVVIVLLVATGTITRCTNKILGATKKFDKPPPISKQTPASRPMYHASSRRQAPRATGDVSQSPDMHAAVSPAVMAGMPKELTQLKHLSAKDIAFLKRDMAHMRNFSLTFDPRSTGFNRSYRQKRPKFRIDDEDLPEAIQKRQHSALGWTNKFDTSSYSQPIRNYAKD